MDSRIVQNKKCPSKFYFYGLFDIHGNKWSQIQRILLHMFTNRSPVCSDNSALLNCIPSHAMMKFPNNFRADLPNSKVQNDHRTLDGNPGAELLGM